MSKKDNRTTLFVAVATFIGLSVISLVAWSLTRPESQQMPSAAPVAAAALAPQAAQRPVLDLRRTYQYGTGVSKQKQS